MATEQTVRCVECGWSSTRKTDLLPNTPHPKPCPNDHQVLVGPWLPNRTEVTPDGTEIAFWDEFNAETGREQQRRYLVNGEKFDSVTKLTGLLDKPGVRFWVARLAGRGLDWQAELKAAGQRGTAAHDFALALLLGKRRRLSDLAPDFRPYGQAISAWMLKRRPKVIEAERMVADVEHRYAGRFDLFAGIGGAKVRVDFKSIQEWPSDQRPPYPDHVLQLDLYEGAAVASGYEAADYGLIVRLGPDGAFDETPFALDPGRGRTLTPVPGALSAAREALRDGLPEPEDLAA